MSGLKILPFIDSMAQILASSDVVVGRAGASTIAELALTGHPTIFVPFPYAADDHQRVNVKLLQDSRAALYVEEKAEDFTGRLLSSIEDLCFRDGHYGKRQDLHKNFLKWGRPQAATFIAKEVLRLAASPV
jgi:UDP-N-acetylglucosamine--N-acetylmuramyl-(pentapeptide) pyrophosphoryl-undecaprenol N-acetylglucosamine transferase